MDTKNYQTTITRILMGVGIVFVVVAVGLFITKSWNYMSDLAKDAMLLIVAAGFFTTSRLFRVKKNLTAVSSVFYYLGAIFIGAFSVLALGGIHAHQAHTNALLLIFADVTVVSLLLFRLFFVKNAIDVVTSVVMLQPLPFLMGVLNESFAMFVLLSGLLFLGVTALYIFLNSYDNMKLAVTILYWVQFSISMLITVMTVFQMGYARVDDNVAMFMAAVTFAASTMTYLHSRDKHGERGFRICQTFSIGFFVIALITFVADLNEFVCTRYAAIDEDLLAIVVYFFLLATLLLLDRIEALFISFSITICMWIAQFFLYDLPYVPLITAVCFGMMLVKQNAFNERSFDDTLDLGTYSGYSSNFKMMDFVKYTLANAVVGVIYVANDEIYDIGDGSCFMIFIIFTLLTVSLMVHSEKVKRVLGVINLLNAVSCVGFLDVVNDSHTILGTETSFYMQIMSTSFLLAAFALKYLLKETEEKTIRNIQFVIVTMVFLGNLSYNLDDGDIFTLLYTGVAALIALALGALKESKRYVVLSALTMCALVIYQTRDFWLSISWWVYLFVVGLALIAFAATREWKRA